MSQGLKYAHLRSFSSKLDEMSEMNLFSALFLALFSYWRSLWCRISRNMRSALDARAEKLGVIAAQDLEHPTNVGWQALGPAIALSATALTLVSLRWLTRLMIVRKVGLDDWLLTASMICSLGLTVGIAIRTVVDLQSFFTRLIGAEFFQRKQVNVTANDWGGFVISMTPTVARLVITNNVLYSTVTNLTKCSIVVQYLRIFSNRPLRIVCYALLFSLAVAGLYGIFAGIFICRPVRKFWDANVEGHCSSASALWLAGAGINIPLDWAVWITPMPVISKLRLPRKQMIGAVVVFALGGFICATSIARLAIVHGAALKHEDTKAGVSSLQWSAIEANVGIICGSLMALKPLVLRFAPNLLADRQPPPRAMHINTISDDDTLDVQFWAGGSVSTTCAGSEATAVTNTVQDDGIKVTTEMEQTAVDSPSGGLTSLFGLVPNRNQQLTLTE